MSGVNEEDCYLTYDIEQDYLTLYIPPITVEGVSAIVSHTTGDTELKVRSIKVIWFGRGSTIKEAEERLVQCLSYDNTIVLTGCSRYDFDEVMLTSSMPDEFEYWLRVNPDKKVYVLRESQSLGPIIHSALKPNYDMISLMPALDASRVIKDHDELVAIKRAIRISSIGHRTIMHHITSLKTEAEVLALYLDVCIAHGSQVQSYPPIIASGANASSLHYFDANDTLEGKSLLCMDAGTEWECYSSDITRTFPLTAKGWPSKETAEIYALVEEMQERCIAMLGPGVRYLDAFILADRIAIEGLMRMGIFREADVDEVLDSGATKAFFPHGLGHHMGLDVHDVSAKPILSMTRRDNSNTRENPLEQMTDMRMGLAPCTSEAALLEPGMVITVEPGICSCSHRQGFVKLTDSLIRFQSLCAQQGISGRSTNLEVY